MARFRFDIEDVVSQNPVEATVSARTVFWASEGEVLTALSLAFSHLKCLVCGDDAFTIIRDVQSLSSPQTVLARWPDFEPTSFVPTLTLSCDDCGFLMNFAEEEVIKKAQRTI